MKHSKTLLFTVFIMTLSFVSCSEGIVSECEPDITVDGQMKASFKEIQDKVLTPSCATSGCHAGTFSPNLEKGKSFANIVNKLSLGSSLDYIEPGDSENSFIIKKLNGDGTTIMPSGSPKLDKAIIDSIAAWIDNGAMNN